MSSGRFGSKNILALSCAVAAAWAGATRADEKPARRTSSIAQSALADLQQSPDAQRDETRNLPLPGEAINLYNPASPLAPKAVAAPVVTPTPTPTVSLELKGATQAPGSSDWLSQLHLPSMDPAPSDAPTDAPTAAAAGATLAADDGAAGGGGGGGGSSVAGTYALPSPVTRASTSTALALPSAIGAQSFAVASAPPSRTPVTGGTTLPLGVKNYKSTWLDTGGFASAEAAGINLGQSVGFLQDATSTTIHAAYWPSSSSAAQDIHPTGTKYTTSHALGISGSQIVGIATLAAGFVDHAYLWTVGQGSNGTDLNPAGYRSSYAKGTSGFLQVGFGYLTGAVAPHALAWAGNATSYTDLNPLNFFTSEALGVSGNLIVGDAEYFDSKGVELHAMLWNGANNTPTDINPTKLTLLDSHATAINGTVIGGYGTNPSDSASHALLWTSLDPGSAIDLNPRGFTDSQVSAINGNVEVGSGHISNDPNSLHALLWTGATGNFLDLSQYLPANFINATASSIDDQGNINGYALNTTTGSYQPVQWTPIAYTPEPGAVMTLGAFVGGWALRRRRQAKG